MSYSRIQRDFISSQDAPEQRGASAITTPMESQILLVNETRSGYAMDLESV